MPSGIFPAVNGSARDGGAKWAVFPTATVPVVTYEVGTDRALSGVALVRTNQNSNRR
jgi:hypothetical protein